MFDRVWQVPKDQFAAVWNGARTLDEAAERMRVIAGGSVPRWALMSRAMELRQEGIELKPLKAAA